MTANFKLYNAFTEASKTGSPWRAKLNYIVAARAEYNELIGIMTPNEQRAIEKDIETKKQLYYGEIITGAVDEFKPKIEALRLAKAGIAEAQGNEIKRWDSSKLNEEIRFAQTVVDPELKDSEHAAMEGRPGAYVRLGGMITEAKQSGDLHKMRGVLEVVRGALSQAPQNQKMEVGMIARAAECELLNLRVTPEMQAAQKAQEAAWNDFSKAKDELIEIGHALGIRPEGPFADDYITKTLRQVRRDREGEIEILDENDPIVTGAPKIIYSE